MKTDRLLGHFQGDAQAYRTAEQIADLERRDAIRAYEARLAESGVLSEEQAAAVWASCRAEVDRVVHMRRLGADRMLDRKIAGGTLRPGEYRAATALLARFSRAAPFVGVGAREYRDGIERELLAARHELVDPRDGLPLGDIDAAADAALAALHAAPALLDSRVAAGRVVEGHGDLRPEHVALGPVRAVIDCLEFARDLRILDPADELAYLSLECERLGAPEVGAAFVAEYRRLSGDEPPERLLHLYAVLRALVRAKLAVRRMREAAADTVRWTARAADYVRLARDHGRRLEAPARTR